MKETSAQQGIQQPDSRILSYAVMQTAPYKPNKSIIMAASALMGLFFSGGLIFLRENLRSVFRSSEEIEQTTGMPVMGQVPLLPVRFRQDTLAYLRDKPTSAAAEAVRNLRTSVLLSNIDQPPKVIMVTSSLPGEGKTMISTSVALNFAGMGKKVLMIEGDLRRRVLGQYFNSGDQKRGLLSVLTGQAELDEVVVRSEENGLDVLFGEKSNTNAADVLSSNRFKAFIEETRARYDIIIIDTPPVLIVPDSRIIAQECDATLFVVKWDSTSRHQVEEAMGMFDNVKNRLSGAVLNQIDPKGQKSYGYGYGYSYGYDVGNKYYTN
nr:tyrosine-protein kinase domain-containing protein [Marinicella sp. W31]MDC2875963.1 polysaccharide biosynthesis tyrosine autokinase [Marinicella sp. W31]